MRNTSRLFPQTKNVIPREIKKYIAAKNTLFIIHGSNKKSKIECLVYIFIGIFLITGTFYTTYLFLRPTFATWDQIKTFSASNFGTLIMFTAPILVMLIAGLQCIRCGIKHFFDPREWYIGTKNALIIIKKEDIVKTGWELFTGKTRVLENNTALELELIEIQEIEDIIIPKTIKLRGLESARNIETICKNKIKKVSKNLEDER